VTYFVQPLERGPVNIGQASNVTKRLIELQGYYLRPLVVLGTIKGGRDQEQALYAKFAHLRLGRAEQFRPATELMEFIGCPQRRSLLSSIELRQTERRRSVLKSRHQSGFHEVFRPHAGGVYWESRRLVAQKLITIRGSGVRSKNNHGIVNRSQSRLGCQSSSAGLTS